MKRPEEVLWLPRSQVSFTVSSRHSIFSRLSWPPAREPLEGGSVLTAEHREQGLPRGTPGNWTQHPAGIRLSSSQRRRPSLSRCRPGGPGCWNILHQNLLARSTGWFLGLSLSGGLRAVGLELRGSDD